jgi:hypothetical protein
MGVGAVSEPYFGLVGTIGEIVREPQAVETGARVPVVRVRLPDGRSVTVPRANVELFQNLDRS